MKKKGVISSLDYATNTGPIIDSNGEDIFFPLADFKGIAREGITVRFKIKPGLTGLYACKVRSLSSS